MGYIWLSLERARIDQVDHKVPLTFQRSLNSRRINQRTLLALGGTQQPDGSSLSPNPSKRATAPVGGAPVARPKSWPDLRFSPFRATYPSFSVKRVTEKGMGVVFVKAVV